MSGKVTNPPPAFHPGNVTNLPGTDGYSLNSNGDGTYTFEAAGGGGGVTVDGTLTDGDSLVYDATDSVYVPGKNVYNVRDFIGGKRSACTTAQTTATSTASSTTITAADGSGFDEGHGIALIGAGAAHGISAPSNCFAIPRNVYQSAPLSSSLVTPIDFTVNTTTDRLILAGSTDPSVRVQMRCPQGQKVRVSNQGGGLPTVSATPLSSSTDYYLRHFAEVRTLVMAGTPTGGTYRLYLYYEKRNPVFHVQEDPLLYIDVAYNASSATLQTAIRTLPGMGQVTISESGSSPNYTHTITFTGVPGRARLAYDTRKLTGGSPTLTDTSTSTGGYKLYTSSSNAINDTSALDFDGAGTGTHTLEPQGSRSYEFQVAALSGKGGITAASSAFSTSLGPEEVDEFQQICIAFDKPSNSRGFVVYGDQTGDQRFLTVVNQMNNIRRVTLQASGFTSWKQGDIGRTLTDGTSSGTIQCYDNTTRNVWVATSGTFGTNGATITTTSGTGGGTQTGASASAYVWVYNGRRFCREYNYYPAMVRRGGEKVWPGLLRAFNNSMYRCIDVNGDFRTDPEKTFTINTTSNVLTIASATANQVNGSPVYVRSSCALPEISGSRLREGTVYYARWATSTTLTLHPTANDATNNTNTVDLTAEGLGTYYLLDCPTFSTTLGAIITDNYATWRRENVAYPMTPPASAVADAHFATVVSRSTNSIVLSAAATTSVTSGVLMHDDTDAMLATFNAANTSGAKSVEILVPGDCNLTIYKADDDTRLYESSFGSGLFHYLFRHIGTTADYCRVTWRGQGNARVIVNALDSSGDLNDDTSHAFSVHSFGRARPELHGIRWCMWPSGTPSLANSNGKNKYTLYAYDVDDAAGGGANAGARVDGPTIKGGGIYGFPQVGVDSWDSGVTAANHVEDVECFYGGSNHDQGWYVNGGLFLRVRTYGIGDERSQALYQDSDSGTPLTLAYCHFDNSRKDGIAVRASRFKSIGTDYVDCTKLFCRENIESYQVIGGNFYETDIIPHNTSLGASDVQISAVRMVDSNINLGAIVTNAQVNDVICRLTAIPRLWTAAGVYAMGFSATGQSVNKVYVDNRASGNVDYRGFNLVAYGSSKFTDCRMLWCRGTWTAFRTEGSGSMWCDKCEFYYTGGGSEASLTTHTGPSKWTGCRFGGYSGEYYNFVTGGRTEFDGNTVDNVITFSSGISGPLYVRRNQFLGDQAITKPGAIVEDNNSAIAIFISGATNLATKGNRIADARSVTAAALNSGTTDDYALPVTDQVRLDPNASNSTISSIVARADGTEIMIICTDGGAATLTLKHNTGGTAANRIVSPTGADIVLSNGERVILRYDATESRWYVVGGQYA